jgi:hypothetical protein
MAIYIIVSLLKWFATINGGEKGGGLKVEKRGRVNGRGKGGGRTVGKKGEG